jgi:hypothetical protein
MGIGFGYAGSVKNAENEVVEDLVLDDGHDELL